MDMSTQPDRQQEQHPHYTRLRDFGAFQVNTPMGKTQTQQSLTTTVSPPPRLRWPRRSHQKQSMTPMRGMAQKKWSSIVVRAACTIVLLALLFRSLSWPALLAALTYVQPGMVLVTAVVGASGVVLSAYQWRSLLRAEQLHLDLADLINLYMIGIAFNHVLPSGMGGDAVKALQLGRKTSNSAGSTSAVVMCRVTGFLGMLLIAVPALIIWHAHFSFDLALWFILLSVCIAVGISGALLATLLLPATADGRWVPRRILTPLIRIGDAMCVSMTRPRPVSAAIAYGFVFWAVAILNCYGYAIALRLDVPFYFFCLVVPLISMISMLPVAINGFGLRENAFVMVFSTVHVPSASALLLALLLDVQSLCLAIAGGLIYLLSHRASPTPELSLQSTEQQFDPGHAFFWRSSGDTIEGSTL
jgi:glycosyltransferase 2 family protein